MLNRAALILRYKQPFVDWINAADPSPASHPLTLAEVNQEHTFYLVEVEDEDELAAWLARHHRQLFEQELNGWYTDPALWPRDRSLTTLKRWCSFELHTVVVDTGGSPMEDDEVQQGAVPDTRSPRMGFRTPTRTIRIFSTQEEYEACSLN